MEVYYYVQYLKKYLLHVIFQCLVQRTIKALVVFYINKAFFLNF